MPITVTRLSDKAHQALFLLCDTLGLGTGSLPLLHAAYMFLAASV